MRRRGKTVMVLTFDDINSLLSLAVLQDPADYEGPGADIIDRARHMKELQDAGGRVTWVVRR